MSSVKRAIRWIGPLVCLWLAGCGTLKGTSGSTVQLVDRDGVDMIAAPAGHVSVMIKDGSSRERVCGGRLPDAIMDSSVGLSLPARSVGVGTTNTDLALGGRNPQVLIVRELRRSSSLMPNATANPWSGA